MVALYNAHSTAHALKRRMFLALAKPRRDRLINFFDTFPVRPGDIVMLGDSLTAEACWSELFPCVSIKNRSLSSDTTGDLLKRLHQVTKGSPSKIFLLIGTNDLSKGDDQTTILTNYERITRRIEQESPETTLYLQSILPRQRRYFEQIVNMNRIIESLAERRGYRYVDLFSLFSGPEGAMRREFSNDRVHLLGLGYERWRDAILDDVCGNEQARRQAKDPPGP
jgi:lysophospholipase L1-like esterase